MMIKNIKLYLIIIIALIISIHYNLVLNKADFSTAYWLWAGITQHDAPTDSELYVYQGLVRSKENHIYFERHGLYPHPIKSKKLYLVYRLEGDLTNISDIVTIFEKTVSQWNRHNVKIDGLQLDFDSPTSKLLIYSNFLQKVREQLPRNYTLSITGLGDWIISGDKKSIRNILSEVDEIVFQLYQGRSTFSNIDVYVKYLQIFSFPFKIGILSDDLAEKHVAKLKLNSNFKGVIYFIQK